MPKRAFNPGYICDDDAYQERLAITLVDGIDVNTAMGTASTCGYGTPWSGALTAAYRGDWAPVNALAEGERHRHGEAWAAGVLEYFKSELQCATERKEWLGMRESAKR
jgi:hypothetical protein